MQGETMGFRHKMPGRLERTCPHVDLAEIEWKTEHEIHAIPYGVLIRVGALIAVTKDSNVSDRRELHNSRQQIPATSK